MKGRYPTPMSLRDLADMIEKELGESVLVHAGGPMEVGSLGIVTGAAARELAAAADAGLDAFLTGEPKHDVFYDAFVRRGDPVESTDCDDAPRNSLIYNQMWATT